MLKEEQTKVLWDFLQTAYRTGAMDAFMDLAGSATDVKYENQSVVFAQLEDAIVEMEDLSGVDHTLELAFRQMPALSDEQTMEGLAALVSRLTPLIESVVASVGGNTELLKQKKDKLLSDLPKMARALFTLLVLNSNSIISALGGKSPKEYGQNLGKGLNAITLFVNDLNERDPCAVPDFMAGVFKTVDKNEMAKMADTFAQALLDQNPPLFRWTASIMAKRLRQKVLGK